MSSFWHPAWHTAWVTALDELETTLDATERLLDGRRLGGASGVPAWQPPALPYPMPVELAPRARQLLDRQSGMIRRAVTGIGDLRQRLELLNKLTGRGDARPAEPVYVDVAL